MVCHDVRHGSTLVGYLPNGCDWLKHSLANANGCELLAPDGFRSYPHPRSKVSYQHMAGSHKYVGIGHKYPRWYMMVYDGTLW